ncbi:hypothetical protein DL770_011504 [Monosporascus sp. CRB-9-2]|nr:hypothetical protein DL770_011504 [Monosporascus sp. CRB-9-2]
MDARGYAANSSSQLTTMATPPSAAMPARFHVIAPRSSPSPAHTASSVSAPNTQRQNTTSATGWPERTTNQPIVPEMIMAAVISTVPRILSFMRTTLSVGCRKDRMRMA